MMTQILTDHTSPETAYLVEDYPYGFRLRCQIRYWLEYRQGYGYRFMSQTSNPKRPGLVWNKPKGSTYTTLLVLYLDEQAHVHAAGIHLGRSCAGYAAFYQEYAGDTWQADQQATWRAMMRVTKVYEDQKAARLAQATA